MFRGVLETVTARYGLVVIPGGIVPDFSEKEKAVKKEFSLASLVAIRSISRPGPVLFRLP